MISSNFVLDTSALLALNKEEPGMEKVESLLRKHGMNGQIWVSFISLMEFYYALSREFGDLEATQSYNILRQMPCQILWADEELGLKAAHIKASHRLSLADAWIAATAQRLDAVLVHKDPEFEQLKEIISLCPLPYKKSLNK